MKVETEVSAFVVRKNMVAHFKTLETAAIEVDEYDFMRICDGHYICKHKDTAYRITIDGDRIGCSCPAMTFHCKGNDGCKHLAAFDRRSAPQKQITADIAMSLLKAGWTGEPGNMTPPETTSGIDFDKLLKEEGVKATSDEDGEDNDGGDPVLPDAEKPELPEKATVTCEHCMKRTTRNSQAEADAWLDSHPCKDRPRQKMIVMTCKWCGVKFEGLLAASLKGEVEAHEMVCDKRPETDSEPPLGAKVYSRTCPHCDEMFDGTDLDEVKDRHRDHITICPDNPANKPKQTSDEETVFECQYCGSKSRYQATIESHEAICPKNPANKQEQKPVVKESLTTETPPEQKEETKMKSNPPQEQTKALDVQNTTEETTAIVPTVASPSIQTTELQQGFLTAAVTLDDAIAAFDMYGIAKTRLLGDADIMYIGAGGTPVKKDAPNATPYIKKSGWRKMARFFGLSVDIVGKEKIWTEDVKGEKYYIWAYQIKVSHQCGAYVISEGVCSSRDKFFTKGGRAEADEKNVMLKAQTVGINRGISDLLGAGEVSAEEMD